MLNCVMFFMMNGGVVNGNDGLVLYDVSSAGAREVIKANDVIGFECFFDEYGVDVNVKDNFGMMLLYLVCLFNCKYVVDVLL